MFLWDEIKYRKLRVITDAGVLTGVCTMVCTDKKFMELERVKIIDEPFGTVVIRELPTALINVDSVHAIFFEREVENDKEKRERCGSKRPNSGEN